jgi:hypothetical protein
MLVLYCANATPNNSRSSESFYPDIIVSSFCTRFELNEVVLITTSTHASQLNAILVMNVTYFKEEKLTIKGIVCVGKIIKNN